MPDDIPAIRGFRAILVAIGTFYALLAGSMLARGVAVMRDFAVPEVVVAAPAFEDFFLFFYELMLALGVLTATFGLTVRDRVGQTRVALVLSAWNGYATWRDLSTSDSILGNRLYRGGATLVPVMIDLVLALVFLALSWAGWRGSRRGA